MAALQKHINSSCIVLSAAGLKNLGLVEIVFALSPGAITPSVLTLCSLRNFQRYTLTLSARNGNCDVGDFANQQTQW